MLQQIARLRLRAGFAWKSGEWAALAEWVLFLLTLTVVYLTIWGKVRVTGPIVVAAVFLAQNMFISGSRNRLFSRYLILFLTIAAAYFLRNEAPSLVAHRVGRFTLIVGSLLFGLYSIPAALRESWRVFGESMKAHPTSRWAYGFALCGVALPCAYFYSTTTMHVWTGDTMPLVPTVVRMATEGERELSAFLPSSGFRRWDACGPGRPYFVREVPGAAGVYSTYPAGMEVFAWPMVLILNACGVDLMDDELHLVIEKWSASILTGCSLGLFFLIALHIGNPTSALVTTYLLATGSVYSSTLGMLLWQQGGIIFWMSVAILVEFQTHGWPSWKGLALQALACGWMLACRPSAVTFLVPFGLWILLRNWKRGLMLPALALVCYLPWGLMYWTLYHNPFGPSMGFLKEHWFPGEHSLSVLLSPARGVFIFQPLFWALLIWPFFHRKLSAPELPLGWIYFVYTVIVFHLVLIASWPIWWGGFCYGSRLMAEVVPLLAMLAVRPVETLIERPLGRLAITMIAVVGLAIHVPCLYYDAWLWNADPISADAHPERLWDWVHPPFLYRLSSIP